ncbi:MxaD family protein [Mycolicibacterium cyprinidarum]|uniref:MxaD family protein n=1 Tax=Mycolicibacterium cyprinidarum TaxID=2860311 RepID=A0ABQ4VBD8_9MYCO|nr:MxaD family protein [Mycolicibacterium sp. NGTWS0302]GJF17872.1 MxaD family protein [Mycolicibacterium sp. NGTWSNA01]
MADVSSSRTIAAAPEAIWEVLADFGSLSTWAEGVDHSCVINAGEDTDAIGLTRRVQVGRDTFVETIVAFAPPRLLAYDIVGVPRAMSATNRWNLQPDSNGRTTVTLTSTVRMRTRLRHPIVERIGARLVAKRSDALLNSLAKQLERTR